MRSLVPFKPLFGAILSLWCLPTLATEPVEHRSSATEPREALRSTVARAFARLPEDGFDGIAEQLSPYDPAAMLPSMARQFGPIRELDDERRGRCLRTEPVSESHAGDSIVRFYYLEVRERGLTIWRLIFCRSGDGWCLRSVRFEGDISRFGDFYTSLRRSIDVSSPDVSDAIAIAESAVGRLRNDDIPGMASILSSAAGDPQVVETYRRELGRIHRSLTDFGWQREKVELIATEPITPSLVRVLCVDQAKNGAAIWEFVFVKPTDHWVCCGFRMITDPEQFGDRLRTK